MHRLLSETPVLNLPFFVSFHHESASKVQDDLIVRDYLDPASVPLQVFIKPLHNVGGVDASSIGFRRSAWFVLPGIALYTVLAGADAEVRHNSNGGLGFHRPDGTMPGVHAFGATLP